MAKKKYPVNYIVERIAISQIYHAYHLIQEMMDIEEFYQVIKKNECYEKLKDALKLIYKVSEDMNELLEKRHDALLWGRYFEKDM